MSLPKKSDWRVIVYNICEEFFIHIKHADRPEIALIDYLLEQYKSHNVGKVDLTDSLAEIIQTLKAWR